MVRGVPHPLFRQIWDEVSGGHPAIDNINEFIYYYKSSGTEYGDAPE